MQQVVTPLRSSSDYPLTCNLDICPSSTKMWEVLYARRSYSLFLSVVRLSYSLRL